MNNPLLIHHLKHLRLQANLTQLYMASQLGKMDEDHYGKLERNQKELKLHCLKKLAHVLELSPLAILQFSGYQCFTPPQFQDNPQTNLLQSKEALHLLNELCAPDNDLHAVHFYIRLYNGIKQLRKLQNMTSKDLSIAMSYSPNHFARMEREYQEISVSQVFQLCHVLQISFVKLMLFSNCFSVFTDCKGNIIALSDVKKKYNTIA